MSLTSPTSPLPSSRRFSNNVHRRTVGGLAHQTGRTVRMGSGSTVTTRTRDVGKHTALENCATTAGTAKHLHNLNHDKNASCPGTFALSFPENRLTS